jgi:hypothetical protein
MQPHKPQVSAQSVLPGKISSELRPVLSGILAAALGKTIRGKLQLRTPAVA